MADYKSYLAARILTEDRAVTYRLLSRALKVNVNTAKQMLYDFYRVQNGKKQGSIHATYLLSGSRKKETLTNGGASKDGDDEHIQSSPFMSSMPQPEDAHEEEIPVMTISLAKEEDLEEVKAQYEQISSIHIYSLNPGPLKDVQILSDITREMHDLCANEDPLEQNKVYGVILNRDVKRRTVRRPAAATATVSAAMSKTNVAKPKVEDTKEAPKSSYSSSANVKKETKTNAQDFFGKSSSTTKPEPTATEKKPPVELKRDSSSIFKAFAKAKPKQNNEGTDSSAAATSAAASPTEDSPMRGMDDDDDDEDDGYVPPPQPAKEATDSDRKSRKEREAALRKMMEEDDEEDVAPPDVEMKEEPTEMEQEEQAEPEPEPEPTSTVSGGRRRGKRRVMKKKTVRDDEGYLVTKEEAVWESFSEDEAPVPAKRQQVSSGAPANKPKKAAAKGQGNIMSFFGKK